MAVIKLQKVNLIGMQRDKKKVLKALQDLEVLQIEEVLLDSDHWRKNPAENHDLDLLVANLEFVIKLLSPFAKKRGALEGPITVNEKKAKAVAENFEYEELAKTCKDLETNYSNAKTTLELLEQAETELKPWAKANISPKEVLESNGYLATYLLIGDKDLETLEKELAEVGPLIDIQTVNSSKSTNYVSMIHHKEYSKRIKEIFTKVKVKEVMLPKVETNIKEALRNIETQKKEALRTLADMEKELKKLAANYETVQIIHDYFKWQKDLTGVCESSLDSAMTFAFSGWIPIAETVEIENILRDKTNNKIAIIPIETDEPSPVALKNHALLQPIENVTTLYGLPIPSEYDPTAFISIFFIAFFGMAVTDAGYGLVMMITMLLVLKYLNLSKQIKSFVKLLMYAGILTFIMGLLYGGWFGMTADQAPAFLLTGEGESLKFIGQIFNPIEDPMTVLILSLVVGYTQVAFGVFIAFISEYNHGSKKNAVLDHLTWFATLIALAVVIMGKAGVLAAGIGTLGLYFLYGGLISLVLTQGRDKPSIAGKAISGILSLYGLVGYFGDVLSYSRLLALGLATAIIGLAVNVVAGLVSGIPFIGWILVIIVLIGGHLFNLVVNALGAFIHAARLQFVEFFSKFLVGGGKPFRPLRKESNYILLEEQEK
ncbi:V-type ATP synthase subunit I [Candidatus Peregrinibacteria bacterium]|nr:V-type ATP synthase subunit I [Candidatus Peregrinibacteria bacterium]